MERKISPVADNEEKRNTYAMLKGSYAKAMKAGFYFQAMLIAYALIEDRLISFLLYIGALNDRNSHKITQEPGRAKQLKMIVASYPDDKGNSNLGIAAISGKMRIIRATLLWSEDQLETPDDQYLKILKAEYEGCLDIGGLLESLDVIEAFCKYRNEVVHAAFNKNYEILNECIEEEVRKVMEAEKFLETQVSALKYKNRIRKTMNLEKI